MRREGQLPIFAADLAKFRVDGLFVLQLGGAN
jgi:hypothetical protein